MDDQQKYIAENFHGFDVLQLLDVIREMCSNENTFFESDPSLAFPPGDVRAVDVSDSQQITVRLPMMNFLGITTPLPIWVADYANSDRKSSEPLHTFLSIMQNCVHSLWIDALRKYRIWGSAKAPVMWIFEKLSARSLDDLEDYDLFWLLAFVGKNRSADGLKRIIRSIWKDAHVDIEENVGRWTTVKNRQPLGCSLRLGESAVVVGTRVFDRTVKFRVSLGPVDIDTYKSLLPGFSGSRLLKNILDQYINEPLICELEVSCYLRDLDLARLRKARSEPNEGGRLGRTMVLGRRRNDDNAILRHRAVILEKFAAMP